MQLVYELTHKPVQIGDVVKTFRGDSVVVRGIVEPHKPSSTGRVYVQPEDGSARLVLVHRQRDAVPLDRPKSGVGDVIVTGEPLLRLEFPPENIPDRLRHRDEVHGLVTEPGGPKRRL